MPQCVRFIEGPVGTSQEIVEGVRAVKLGGHFPGSLVLHWERMLFIADTILTVPVSSTVVACYSCDIPAVISFLISFRSFSLLADVSPSPRSTSSPSQSSP